MDTSKIYIAMSDNEDLQKDYSPHMGDFAVRKCEYPNYSLGIVCWNWKGYPELSWMTLDGEDGITLKNPDEYLEKLICLFRQDQLQEMMGRSELYSDNIGYSGLLFEFATLFSDDGWGMPSWAKGLKTMEQIWLAFLMKEKYGKIWNGEYWEKQPESLKQEA